MRLAVKMVVMKVELKGVQMVYQMVEMMAAMTVEKLIAWMDS